MATNTTTPAANQASARTVSKPNLTALYRPLGLKAVAAAAMMLKRKPKTA